MADAKKTIPILYQDVGNAFVKTVKNDPKDRIKVTLGDDKQPDFKENWRDEYEK